MKNRRKPLIKTMYNLVFLIGFLIAIKILFSYHIFDNLFLEILVILFVESIVTSIYFFTLKLIGKFRKVDIETWKEDNSNSSNLDKVDSVVAGASFINHLGSLGSLLSGGLSGVVALILIMFLGLFILKYIIIYILMKMFLEFLILATDHKPIFLLFIGLFSLTIALFVFNSDVEDDDLNNGTDEEYNDDMMKKINSI